jgi:hypothetical protein
VDRNSSPALKGRVRDTPDQPQPYAVVIWRGEVLVRSKPVGSLPEAERKLSEMLAEVAEWPDGLG